MKRLFHWCCFGLVWLLAACGAEPEKPAPGLRGQWVGLAETKPFPELLTFTYDSTLTLNLFYGNLMAYSPDSMEVRGNEISFEVISEYINGKYKGTLRNGVIEGGFAIGMTWVPCRFVQYGQSSLEQLFQAAGYYEMGPGHVVQLSPFSLGGDHFPVLTDFQSGVRRLMYPKDSTHFFGGASYFAPSPTVIQSVLSTDADSNFQLSVQYQGQQPQVGKRLADLDDTEDIEVRQGSLTLRGTIVYPKTKGPHPLVVWVHGGGEQYRGAMNDEWVRMLPYYGVAVLSYDKRGCGESDGNLQEATYEDLAEDVLAVANFARQHPRIDPARIGLAGTDQAGLVMPIAAAKAPYLRFVASLAGSVLAMEAQERLACQKRMQADGFGQDDQAAAQQYLDVFFGFVQGQKTEADWKAAFKAIEKKDWTPYVVQYGQEDFVRWWQRNIGFSALPYWKKVRMPVLAIFGENDLIVPAAQNVPLMQEAILKKHPASQVHVLPKANHLLMLGETRGDYQLSEIIGYAPGAFGLLHEWIGEQAGVKKP